MEDLIGIFIVIFLIILAIQYVTAKKFLEIAYMKGYDDSSYFWYCFLFGIAGYLMVVALPNRNARVSIKTDNKQESTASKPNMKASDKSYSLTELAKERELENKGEAYKYKDGWFCKSCGTKNEKNAISCRECGAYK